MIIVHILLALIADCISIQVLVKTLFDRGVLFLLSSSQMVDSKGTKKLFPILFTEFSVVSVEHLPTPLCERLAACVCFFVKKTKQKKKTKALSCLYFREAGATGEELASIIHLSGVKDCCQVL